MTTNSGISNGRVHLTQGIQVDGGRTRILVENIKCGGCGKTISKALGEIGLSNIVTEPDLSFVEFDSPDDYRLVAEAVSLLKSHGYPMIDSEDGLRAVALKAKSFLSCAVGKLR